MKDGPVFISGMGIISALGHGSDQTLEALRAGRSALGPLTVFKVASGQDMVVGAVTGEGSGLLPRSHQLAHRAAEQALAGIEGPPDAIVLGSTTGGILTTEAHLEQGRTDPEGYRFHGLSTVAEDLARRYGCSGPVITISTACSSGAVAIKVAMELLRCGMARRVLAGGVDSLCRLTCFGFKSLQLVDPHGARPLDRERRGMSVGEGAALLMLTRSLPDNGDGLAVLGAGLSCDAHHATAPHPEGKGALAAMRAALADAALSADALDYINLHGTGTLDNDLAEARALRTLFPEGPPALSSIKGATGHALAAAGAMEAVVAALCIRHGLVPANVGYRTFDPDLNLKPVTAPVPAAVRKVLSNSFGFGGNNAALVLGATQSVPTVTSPFGLSPLRVEGYACVTGAGHTGDSLARLLSGNGCAGQLDEQRLAEGLPPRTIRRFKRLPKLSLALAANACRGVPNGYLPTAVSMGTAWGALSETYDFLMRLARTEQQYPSPTDFVGSVHNAPAGQIAMMLGATGANVTTTGGDSSFEQALLVAHLLTRCSGESILVAGADETHAVLSPLFDPSVRRAATAADGGGALLLRARGNGGTGPLVTLICLRSGDCPEGITDLVTALGGPNGINRSFGAVLVGLPAAEKESAAAQLAGFLSASGFDGPLVDYRRLTGEFAAASAVAAVMGVALAVAGTVPGALTGGTDISLRGKAILILGLGARITAVKVSPP